MRKFLLLVGYEIRSIFAANSYIFESFALFLIINFLLNYFYTESLNLNIIISLMLSSSLILRYTVKRTYDNSISQQILLAGISTDLIVISKIIPSFLILVFCALSGILIKQIIDTETILNLYEILIFTLLCFGISEIIIFSSLITCNIKNSEIVGFIISFPLMLGFVLYNASILLYTSVDNMPHELLIIFAILLIITPLCVWSCGKLISRI